LDNTLWDGILLEDGAQKIRIRQLVVDIIKETDRRGILHSIASKNNVDDAMKILQLNGLDELFLYPQISWNPKSESIAKIARLLNIGIDTVAFVDDQQFEREEVKSALPQITAIDAVDLKDIVDREECAVPITDESRQRRSMYKQQQHRDDVLSSFKGNYLEFIRECDIRLHVGNLEEDNLERVYELAQRTNQMNFSGKRYTHDELKSLMASKSHETWVIRCVDKFGSYGIAGFAVVDLREPRLVDIMFSCRIQGKRVEHAFFNFLLRRYVHAHSQPLFANYRRNTKNAAAGKVFEDMNFEALEEKEGILSLVFKSECPIPDDRVIQVIV